jgi:hypothetical protein
MVPHKAPVLGFGGATAGLPVWGAKKRRIEKIENHGALDLGGPHLLATHNNQPIVGRSGRGDAGEKARGGYSVWKGVVPSFEAMIGTTKIYIYNSSAKNLTINYKDSG